MVAGVSREESYNEMEKQAEELIKLAKNSDGQVVLYRYYIMGQNYPQIEAEMHYSDRWVMQLRADALADLEAVNCAVKFI